MSTVIFKNIETDELIEYEKVTYVSNREGSYMIIVDNYPEFLDNTKFVLWRLY